MRLIVLTIMCLFFGATYARAECTNVAYASVGTGYVFQDLGVMASNKASLQAGATRTCGKWSVDLWTATELSSKGAYGKRGYGDEVDLTVNYDTTINNTPIGPISIQASAAYFVMASFPTANDDVLQVYVDVGRPMKMGRTTVTPFVRTIQWIGVGDVADETLLRAGARFSLPISTTWSVDGEASNVFLTTSGSSAARGRLSLTKDFGNGLTVSANAKITETVPVIASVEFAKTF